jgi:hypothetical protein
VGHLELANLTTIKNFTTMMNPKDLLKSVDWKSACIGVGLYLLAEATVVGAVKGVKAAAKYIKSKRNKILEKDGITTEEGK